MAYKAYLKADGVPGISTDSGHAGEIDIMSYSLGASSESGSFGYGGGTGTGKVTLKDMSVTKLVDPASSTFFNKCLRGEKIDNALLTVEKADNPKQFVKYAMENVYVTAVNMGGEKDNPIENLTFNFAKLTISQQLNN